ncbi:DNA recombination protein RmuC [Candidatus Gottesmanbacteria bacterium]|nr:DNA recombination protein RmuC [Candidatus Gottesmanbacteria bacterium]
MTSPELLMLLGVIVIGFVVVFWLVKNEFGKLSGNKDNAVIVEWLKSMHSSLDVATGVIGDLKKSLGEMSEVGKGIRSLQEFLQSPKLRGNIGEQVLQDMIGQTFPKNSFHLQYSFRSGVKVDAVLKTDAGLLCIDSKFPMENFTLMHKGETEAERIAAKRDFIADVKKHVNDISKKYILPEEGTMDFALMYIPSESVYYEIANMNDLMDYARRARVYPVSPNTLYAHLQVLLLSFQGKELEQKSREVFQLLRAIQKDYGKVEENLGVLGRHVNNAYNSMSTVTSGFQTLGQKLSRTQTLSTSEEKQLELDS